jgi:hypothetical protein
MYYSLFILRLAVTGLRKFRANRKKIFRYRSIKKGHKTHIDADRFGTGEFKAHFEMIF